MAQIANNPHTVGNRIRYSLDYSIWLPDGVSVTSATVVSSSTTCTVDTITFPDNKVFFFLNGGKLAEVLIVTVSMTDSKGEIKLDTMRFFCVNP